ncbi:MAG: tRNA 2-thiouridine(34) synthase MnmA [Patescibacteria group bacterium]
MNRQDSKQRKKVYVGLSGGVDSSVSAALLKLATPNNFEKLFGRPTPKGFRGYDVTGVFIKVWSPDWLPCTWREDRLDAMRVAAKLGIPFVTLDLEKEYKKEVVDYMIAEYKAGRTPNPDVACNRSVKFGGFYKWAMNQGADFVATGHYAQVMPNKQLTIPTLRSELRLLRNVGANNSQSKKNNLKIKIKEYQLLTGLDKNKDQSYFLWTLSQEQLAHTLFPVGNIEKPEVRRLAKKFGLITADKKDSQGLCFIGKIDIKDFLKRSIPTKKGKVLSVEGKEIGSHDGATFLTIGERHGFTITQKTTLDTPYYVVAKDVKKNTITVSHKKPDGGLSGAVSEMTCIKMNWIGETPKAGDSFFVRTRYRQTLEPVTVVSITAQKAVFHFARPQSTITSGQSAVFYLNDTCIGGGVIS